MKKGLHINDSDSDGDDRFQRALETEKNTLRKPRYKAQTSFYPDSRVPKQT